MKTFIIMLILETSIIVSTRRLVFRTPSEFTTSTISTTTTVSPNSRANLIAIGTFNGESYFGDRVLRNWNESKSFCESQGLMIAKIDDEEQLQFLRNNVRTVVRQQWSWVSDRGDHEVNKSCRKFGPFNRTNRCPILAPYGQGYVRRYCSQRRFALCQSVDTDHSEEFVNPHFVESSEETTKEKGSSEEIQFTAVASNPTSNEIEKESGLQVIIERFIRRIIEAMKQGNSSMEENSSSSESISESESSE